MAVTGTTASSRWDEGPLSTHCGRSAFSQRRALRRLDTSNNPVTAALRVGFDCV